MQPRTDWQLYAAWFHVMPLTVREAEIARLWMCMPIFKLQQMPCRQLPKLSDMHTSLHACEGPEHARMQVGIHTLREVYAGLFAETAEPAAGNMGSEGNPIAGVLVFKDPNDWYRDTQLVLDVLTSGTTASGWRLLWQRSSTLQFAASEKLVQCCVACTQTTSLERYSKPVCCMSLAGGVPGRDAPPEGAEPVQLYFANPDMLWANEFPTPRLGQGAFAACIKLLYREVSHGADR